MAEACELVVTMDAASADALAASGYVLYAFAAVTCGDRAGLPLVWMRTEAYSAFTYLQWGDELEAFTSFSPLAAGARVQPGFSAAMEPGETLTVGAKTGTGSVGPGPAGQVSILNGTQTRFTCGLSIRGQDGVAPVCALPLFGEGVQSIAPLSQLLLMFSTAQLVPGTAVGSAIGPAALVDVSALPRCTVRFQLNQGWTSTGSCPVRPVAALTRLAPLLLVAPASGSG